MHEISQYSISKNIFFIFFSLFLNQLIVIKIEARVIDRICIDPGHGKRDGGCENKELNIKEKDICLEVAKKLGSKIKKKFPKMTVIYTRTNDSFVKLKDRSELANKKNASMFLSIHCNYHNNKKVKGFEVYVMDKTYKHSKSYKSRILDTVLRENAVVTMEKNYKKNYKNFNQKTAHHNILFTNYNNAYHHASTKFADIILKNAKKIGRKIRNVMEGPFYVLRETTVPSVLVEIGFISNTEEGIYLNSNHGQENIANSLFQSIKEFKYMLEHDI